MNIHRLRQGFALSLLALLAACGATPAAQSPGGSGYLLTVNLGAEDTRESVAQTYGGRVIAWLGDRAILEMTDTAVAQLQTRGVSMQNAALEANTRVSAPAAAQGWNAWGSGWNAWGSGWNAWGSGWNAWSGGNTVPTMPGDNRKEYMLTRLPQAHAISRNYGKAVRVAVIDTGIDLSHPMFNMRLDASNSWRDFVDGDATPQEAAGTMYGHGTAVAGVILQVAPKATILPIRVLGPDGSGDMNNVIAAIDHAITRGAAVINLSLGSTTSSDALQAMIAYAAAQGVHVVASAGNDASGTLTFPAGLATTVAGSSYVISVGSATATGGLSAFSNYGSNLEVLAPGEAIVSSYPDRQIGVFTGTSFAAPYVAGMIAVARSDTTQINFGGIEGVLKSTLQPSLSSGYALVNTSAFSRGLPGFLAKRAYFVAGSTALGSGDAALVARLQALGYAVTVQDDDLLRANDVSAQDVVLYSSSASLNGAALRGVNVPVVVWRADQLDDLGMVAASSRSLTTFGSVTRQTNLQLRLADHPLSGGIDAASPIVYSTADTALWGLPSSSAVSPFSLAADATKPAVFGYNSGAAMVGLNAPARRVGFFLGGSPSNLTREGWNLFEAAVTWAVSGN